MCQCLAMLAVRRHGQGKRLDTCLVLESRALCVVSLQHVPMFHSAGRERLNMLLVHGHGRGTCLMYTAFVVAFVACFNGYEFFVLYLILLH